MQGGTRDWAATLQPASYNGFAFFVETEALPKSGREVAVHSYVNAEAHDTEDMGRVPRTFSVAAYLASDSADTDAQQFIELCSTAGVFPLVLPVLGTYQVRCLNCHASAQDREKQGYVKFELEFIEGGTAGGAVAAFPATSLGDRQAASTMQQMPAAAQGAVSGYDPNTAATAANQMALQHLYEGG
jgi:prophage DNA circulation protein